jgi:hypothetical protein
VSPKKSNYKKAVFWRKNADFGARRGALEIEAVTSVTAFIFCLMSNKWPTIQTVVDRIREEIKSG